MKPSPRPWRIVPYDNDHECIGGDTRIYDARYRHLASVEGDGTGWAEDTPNAEHIVHCVNLFDELVSRLEAMCDLAELDGGFEDEDGWRSIARSREVLEKARKTDG